MYRKINLKCSALLPLPRISKKIIIKNVMGIIIPTILEEVASAENKAKIIKLKIVFLFSNLK